MHNKIIYIVIAILCFSRNITAEVEHNDSSSFKYLTTQFYKASNPVINSNIASDICFSDFMKYSEISLNFEGEYGNYHRVQEAKEISCGGFSAEGSASVYGFLIFGNLTFSEDFKDGIRFATLLDPFRGTPYQLADSTLSNWKIQNYRMWTNIARTIIPERLSGGLKLSLNVARGAKMIDPRPRTNNTDLHAIPSFTFKLGNHKLGLGGEYNMYKEFVNMILYNSSETQKIYSLKGSYQYTYDIFSKTERERQYDGYGVGGLISYSYNYNNSSIYVEGNYRNYGESVSDIENNKPRLRGKFYNDSYNIKGIFQNKGRRVFNSLKLSYNETSCSGKEIIQIFNSSPNVNNWETDSEAPARWRSKNQNYGGEYKLSFLNNDASYSAAEFICSANKYCYEESYKVMNSGLNYNLLNYNASINFNLKVKSNSFISLGVMGSYNSISDFEGNYKEREIDNPTIKDMLFEKDMFIINQNNYSVGGNVGYGYKFKSGNSLSLNLKYSYLRAEKELYRHSPVASLSLNF